MLRQIKFRIWDKKLNCYENWAETEKNLLEEILIHPKGLLVAGSSFLDENNFVVQQFTGLQDKNGRDIFEGDIVLLQEGQCDFAEKHTCEIFVKQTDHSAAFFHARPLPRDDRYRQFSLYRNTYEIIGNIFENPELLK